MTNRNWGRIKKHDMRRQDALAPSDLARFRSTGIELPPPPRPERRDPSGRRITLPRVSILERPDAVA